MYVNVIENENKEGWYALLLAITQNLSVKQAISAIKHGGFGKVDRTMLAAASKVKSLRRVAAEFHCSKNTVAEITKVRPIQMQLNF